MVKLICLCSAIRASLSAGRAWLPLAAGLSSLPHHADDHALDLHVVRVDEDRLHRRVGRLQADAAVVAVELLQRDVGAAEQRDRPSRRCWRSCDPRRRPSRRRGSARRSSSRPGRAARRCRAVADQRSRARRWSRWWRWPRWAGRRRRSRAAAAPRCGRRCAPGSSSTERLRFHDALDEPFVLRGWSGACAPWPATRG